MLILSEHNFNFNENDEISEGNKNISVNRLLPNYAVWFVDLVFKLYLGTPETSLDLWPQHWRILHDMVKGGKLSLILIHISLLLLVDCPLKIQQNKLTFPIHRYDVYSWPSHCVTLVYNAPCRLLVYYSFIQCERCELENFRNGSLRIII
jgi:hypothetical protein